MNVFDNDGVYSGGMEKQATSLRPCKRDYESDIKRVREGQRAAIILRDAIYDYLDKEGGSRSGKPFTLGELIGRLEMDIRDAEKMVVILISEQEREKA